MMLIEIGKVDLSGFKNQEFTEEKPVYINVSWWRLQSLLLDRTHMVVKGSPKLGWIVLVAWKLKRVWRELSSRVKISSETDL